jgi:ABC-2 type transport system ATP-binding protein
MSKFCLQIHAVSHSYRAGFFMFKSPALQDLTLEIPARSVFGLLGANGSGKTTLIHLITGLRKPTRGKVEVFGHSARTLQSRSHIGYLPERPYFHEHLTSEQLLMYFGLLAGMHRTIIHDRCTTVLEQVGLSHARHQELKTFSKGMLQRIGIAQALIHDPELLVLDEPMSGLDPIGRKDIRDIISGLAAEGRSIFFSSHVIPDVEAICTQVGIIHKGKLIQCGPIGEFLQKGKLSTEIGFSGLSEKLTKHFPQAQPIENGHKIQVSGQTEVSDALQFLLSHEAKILWVTPIRISLETYFEQSYEKPTTS